MKNFIKWCNWELKNDYAASCYFAVMLLMYCIIKLIFGDRDVDIVIIIELYLCNYVLVVLQRIFLDEDKEYSTKSFIIRATVLSIISILTTVAVGELGGWFDGMPFWAGFTVYTMLILSYITVWIIIKAGKKYDTHRLNSQLANFKKNNKIE